MNNWQAGALGFVLGMMAASPGEAETTNILGVCWFGQSSVAAVETKAGVELRINNTLADSHEVQYCSIDAGYVAINLRWTPFEGTVPDWLDVQVSPGWQAYPSHSVINDNNLTTGKKTFDLVFITPELMG